MRKPVLLVVNKVDAVPKPLLLPFVATLTEVRPFDEVLLVSALDRRRAWRTSSAPRWGSSPRGRRCSTPRPSPTSREIGLAAELIREQVLRHCRQEVPHSAAVVVDAFDESERAPRPGSRPGGLQGLVRIHATLFVERDSQKAIVIGKRGAMLKTIGTDARKALERLLGTHVYLDLRVKVEPRWTETERGLRKVGLDVRPLVAIVGRPNVGKSTLFNRLAERRLALVQDVPGVTRDRHYADTEWQGRPLTVVDTGGFVPDEEGGLAAQVRAQAELAAAEADVVLMVVDGRAGPTGVDESLARALRRTGKPVLLVVNKLDSPAAAETGTGDFYRLGIREVFPVSAEHALGFDALAGCGGGPSPGSRRPRGDAGRRRGRAGPPHHPRPAERGEEHAPQRPAPRGAGGRQPRARHHP